MSYCFGEGCNHPAHAEEKNKKVEEVLKEIKSGSAAAAPRGEQSEEDHSRTVTQTVLHNQTNKDSERQRKWFDSGVRAKQRGYGDMSPFYENKTADYFFKCGYAGTSFEQAQETLRTEIEQILKQDSTLSESVNELVVDNNDPKVTDFLP